MDIEIALKTIGDWISKETESRKYPIGELLELSESLQALKSEIARQSVKSEEVQRAIGDLLDMKEHWCADSTDNDAISIDLAITALKAYQPWVSVEDRLPTKDDADDHWQILAYSEGLQQSTICLWYHIIGDNVTTHWRGNVEPPKGE